MTSSELKPFRPPARDSYSGSTGAPIFQGGPILLDTAIVQSTVNVAAPRRQSAVEAVVPSEWRTLYWVVANSPGLSFANATINFNSKVLGVVLGGALVVSNWVSEGLQGSCTYEIANGTSSSYQAIHGGTGPSGASTTDFLKSRISVLLSEAENEDLEIGVTSTLSRRISRLIAEYGTMAVEALRDTLETRLPGDEVMSVVLRQLGRAQEKSSHRLRRDLLISLLRSRSVQTRHAAATGLAELDDPAAIPALQLALEKEPHERPREHLELVLKQLRDTQQQWLSIS